MSGKRLERMAAFKQPDLYLRPQLPAELRATRVPVFYATTRVPAGPDEPDMIGMR